MTDSLVSEALMEATWQRIGGCVSRTEIMGLQQACSKDQEELTTFVFAVSSKLSHEAMRVCLYAHVVIAEAFRRSGAGFRAIKPAKIMRAWDRAQTLAASLMPFGRSAVEQHAEFTSDPAVFRYIVGAMEEDVENDDVLIDDEEFWQILSILQTVSDCLHDAKKSR